MQDRRRTEHRPGQTVNFVLLEPDVLPPFDKVTSVVVVPFTFDGKIVAVRLARGVDLPGGHVLETERTIEETARREVLEEAGITLSELMAVKVIQSDYYGSDPQSLTYMVLLTAFVATVEDFTPCLESEGRLILGIDEFLAQYVVGDRDWMQRLVLSARGRLFGGS